MVGRFVDCSVVRKVYHWQKHLPVCVIVGSNGCRDALDDMFIQGLSGTISLGVVAAGREMFEVADFGHGLHQVVDKFSALVSEELFESTEFEDPFVKNCDCYGFGGFVRNWLENRIFGEEICDD